MNISRHIAVTERDFQFGEFWVGSFPFDLVLWRKRYSFILMGRTCKRSVISQQIDMRLRKLAAQVLPGHNVCQG